jgi:hypothetical protein|tara:strand:+ start:703 stop:909 length:207 start_codon:yes stop_codon:yes gene_type:complete
MAQTIKLKRKFTSGAPDANDLVEGEIAVNTADQKIYMRDGSNNIVEVANVAAAGATVDDATALAIALG